MRSWTELIVAILARSVIGTSLGVLGAVVGYFVAWMLVGPGVGLLSTVAIWTAGTGIGAGLAGFIGWVKLDADRRENLVPLGLALAGGLIGAWSGLIYAREVFGADIKSLDARITAVAAAAIVANLVPGVVTLITLTWRRET